MSVNMKPTHIDDVNNRLQCNLNDEADLFKQTKQGKHRIKNF